MVTIESKTAGFFLRFAKSLFVAVPVQFAPLPLPDVVSSLILFFIRPSHPPLSLSLSSLLLHHCSPPFAFAFHSRFVALSGQAKASLLSPRMSADYYTLIPGRRDMLMKKYFEKIRSAAAQRRQQQQKQQQQQQRGSALKAMLHSV